LGEGPAGIDEGGSIGHRGDHQLGLVGGGFVDHHRSSRGQGGTRLVVRGA
jgi:hypothetical protein